MLKAAFFDIDGTLLSFNTHKVSEGTVRAFDTLHRHGVRTFISSGRPMVLIPPMPVSFEAYITMNGGLVFLNDERRTTLLSNPIPDSDRDTWIDFARQHNLCTMTFTADSMMVAQEIAQDVKVGHQEKEHLRDQNAEDDEDGILDPRPPVPEIDLREKVFGRQGAGEEHRADEHGLHEPVAQAGEDDCHQQDGEDPVGYDEQPFHCRYKNSIKTVSPFRRNPNLGI